MTGMTLQTRRSKIPGWGQREPGQNHLVGHRAPRGTTARIPRGVRQAIIVVPERSIGGSFADAPLSRFGLWADWEVKPRWNLCNAPGVDEPRVAKSKVKAVGEFLRSDDRVLICTHATYRFVVDELGVEAFDECLIAVDEFHPI